MGWKTGNLRAPWVLLAVLIAGILMGGGLTYLITLPTKRPSKENKSSSK